MDFSSSLTKKRFEFWDHVKKGTPMQSVRYENIHMLPNDQEDDSIGCYSEAEDFEEDDWLYPSDMYFVYFYFFLMLKWWLFSAEIVIFIIIPWL